MKKLFPLFLLLPVLGAVALFVFPPSGVQAQSAGASLAAGASTLSSQDPGYARLRGTPHFYLEVVSAGMNAEEAELRNELRDLLELDLRRANISVKTASPTEVDAVTPVLRLNLKWERSVGRAECILELSVLDKVMVVRNKEVLTATIFEMKRPVNILTDQTAWRDIKGRTRDLLKEFCGGLRRMN
jgi:hypothetical protein